MPLNFCGNPKAKAKHEKLRANTSFRFDKEEAAKIKALRKRRSSGLEPEPEPEPEDGHSPRRASTGGGTDYVCLHSAPMYTDWDPRQNPTGSARLYYAEYAFGTAAQLSNLWKLNEKHVPCAVCQSRGAIATYMQPGSILCAAGWGVAYRMKKLDVLIRLLAAVAPKPRGRRRP